MILVMHHSWGIRENIHSNHSQHSVDQRGWRVWPWEYVTEVEDKTIDKVQGTERPGNGYDHLCVYWIHQELRQEQYWNGNYWKKRAGDPRVDRQQQQVKVEGDVISWWKYKMGFPGEGRIDRIQQQGERRRCSLHLLQTQRYKECGG